MSDEEVQAELMKRVLALEVMLTSVGNALGGVGVRVAKLEAEQRFIFEALDTLCTYIDHNDIYPLTLLLKERLE